MFLLLSFLTTLLAPTISPAAAKWNYELNAGTRAPRSIDIPQQWVGVSPDGNRVYLWDDGAIQVWDAKLESTTASIPHEQRVGKFHVTDDHIYASGADGSVTAYDRENHKERWRVSVGTPHPSGLINIDVSPNGKLVAVSARDEVAIFSTKGKLKSKMKSTGGFVLFTPDSKYISLHQPRLQTATFFQANRKLNPKKPIEIKPPKGVGYSVFGRAPGRKKLVAIAGNGVYEVGPKSKKWKRVAERTKERTEPFLVSASENALFWLGRDPKLGAAVIRMEGKKAKLESYPFLSAIVSGFLVAHPSGNAYYHLLPNTKKPKVSLTRYPLTSDDAPASDWEKVVDSWMQWSADGTLLTGVGRFDPKTGILTSSRPPSGKIKRSIPGFDLLEEGSGDSARYVLHDRAKGTNTTIETKIASSFHERRRVSIAPGGAFLVFISPPVRAAGSSVQQFQYELFDVASQSVLKTWTANNAHVTRSGTSYRLEGPHGDATTVAEDRDGKELWRSKKAGGISGVSDDGQRLLSNRGLVDAKTGELVLPWEHHGTAILSTKEFLPGTNRVFLGWLKPQEKKLWFEVRDTVSGELIATGDFPATARLVSMSPDGSYLIAVEQGSSQARAALYRRTSG
ncbi:MAG: PQQ-binding-like beta-propeller repeat protein [Planctomycetota bacterium]